MNALSLTLAALPHRRQVPASELTELILQACRPGVLDPDEADALAAEGIEHVLRPGAIVLRRGDVAGSVWLVAQGRMAVGVRGPQGMSQLRCTVGRGHWLDLASGLSLSRHPEDAVVEQDAVVWEFPAAAVQRLFESHPGLAPALAACLGGQVHQLIAGTRELMTKDVQARCATWLLQQAAPDRDEGRGGAAVLRLQQRKRAIALQLGTTAETFSRTLRDLSRHGLIDVKGYSIELLDIEGLRGIAGTAQR